VNSKTALVLAIVFSVLLFGTAGARTAHAMPADAEPAQAVIGYHVVQPTETIFCIARAYRVDPWVIAYSNGLVNPNYIYPGMSLRIPAGPPWWYPGRVCPAQPQVSIQSVPAPRCQCVANHTVVPGDTLFRMSVTYGGVSPWDIAECNGLYNLNYVPAYTTLCIPAASMLAPPGP